MSVGLKALSTRKREKKILCEGAMKTVKNENENYEEEKLAAKNHPTNCFNFISEALTL